MLIGEIGDGDGGRHDEWYLGREGQSGQVVLGELQVFLLGGLLGVDEGASAGLVDPELVASDFGLLARCDGECLGDAGGVCELDEAELVFAGLVGVLAAVAYAEVEDNAALLVVLEELLETADVDLVDGVNPDGAVGLLLVEVLDALEQVHGHAHAARLVQLLQLVDALVVAQVVPDEQLLQPVRALGHPPHALQDALVGQEVEAQAEHAQVAGGVGGEVGGDGLEALVADAVVAELQEFEGGVEADDVFGYRLGAVVAYLVVEDIEELETLVVPEALGELVRSRHAHPVLAQVQHLQHVVERQHARQHLHALLVQVVLREVQHLQLALELLAAVVERQHQDVGHVLLEAGGLDLEGGEVWAVGEYLDVLGLLLVEEFVVVGEDEGGVEVGAGVELEGAQVVVVGLVVVAGDHLGELVGVAVPLLLVVLAHAHAPVEVGHGLLVAHRPRQVQERQTALLLGVEGHCAAQVPDLGAEVAAVGEVQHPQALALAQRHPELPGERVVEVGDLVELEDLDAGADLEHLVEGNDCFVDVDHGALVGLDGDFAEVEQDEVGVEGEVVDDGGEALPQSLLDVHAEDLELLHAHECVGQDLALLLVEGALAHFDLLQVLDVDQDVAQHLHRVALGQDVRLAEPQRPQRVRGRQVPEQAFGEVLSHDDVVKGDDVEAALGVVEVGESLLDGLGGLGVEAVVELGESAELDVLEGGELREDGGDVVVAALDVADLDEGDEEGVDVVARADVQLLVEGREVGVHVDVLQEVLQVQPQEQPLPVHLRHAHLRLLVPDVRVLVVVLDDAAHAVLRLRDPLLRVLQRLHRHLRARQRRVRQQRLLHPRPPLHAHLLPVLLAARLLGVLEAEVALLALGRGELDEAAVGGHVGVELAELLLAGGEFGREVDLAGGLLALGGDGLLPLHDFELVVVLLAFGVLDGLLEEGGEFCAGAVPEADVAEVVSEVVDVLGDVEDLCLEAVLLLVGELAEVVLVVGEQGGGAAVAAHHLSQEQLVEAEHVEAGLLRLEHHLRALLVRSLVQRLAQQLGHRTQDPEHLPVQLLPEVRLRHVPELEGVGHRQVGEDAAQVGDVVLVAVVLALEEGGDGGGEGVLEVGEAGEGVEEHGVDVGEDADDADGGVLLLVHDVVDEGDEQFGEDLEDELGLEVLGGVGHDHGERLLEEVEEAVLVVALPEVDGQPVRDLLVVGGEVAALLDEGLQGDVVEVGLALLDQPRPRDLGDAEPEAELVLQVGEFGVEADQFPAHEGVLVLHGLELLEGGLLAVEGGPEGELAAVLAGGALEGVGVLDGLLDLHLHLGLVGRQVLLEEEALELGEHALDAVGRGPAAALLARLGLLEDVEADVAAEDVGMGDVVEDADGGRVGRVGLRELELEVEDAALVERLLGPADVGVPGEQVALQRPRSHAHCWDLLLLDLLQVPHEPPVRRRLQLLVERGADQRLVEVSSCLLHKIYRAPQDPQPLTQTKNQQREKQLYSLSSLLSPQAQPLTSQPQPTAVKALNAKESMDGMEI